MKTKLTKRFSKLIAILAFLALLAGNAFAIENKSRVVSPYWQSDSTSYTFIAVSHTSLTGMASQIGLTMTAITNTGGTFGSAINFTVDSGKTTRVFIVRTIHTLRTSIPAAEFISGTTNFAHGHVRIDPIATNPTTVIGFPRAGFGQRDSTMLSYWGSVVIEQNTTGFAMEFIGDMNDSQATHVLGDRDGSSAVVVGPGAP